MYGEFSEKRKLNFGNWNVSVSLALIIEKLDLDVVSANNPEGTSIEITFARLAFIAFTTAAGKSRMGFDKPIPKMASMITSVECRFGIFSCELIS